LTSRANIFYFLLFLLSQTILGQTDSLINFDMLLESILNKSEIEQEDSQLFDLIEQYVENPIDLNKSTKSEIMALPLLDIEIANAIINYRSKYGMIFSYSELRSAKNISSHSITILKAFTYLKKKPRKESLPFLHNYNFKLRSRVSQKIQKTEGYKTGYFEGSPIKLYDRLKLDINSKIKVGLLVDKDAGEKSYFDFYSFYIQVKGLFKGLDVLAGYYTMEFGQGLAIWSPYSFAKSSEATNSIIKRARGISPYTSAGEYLYLKGAAINYSNSFFKITSFYSLQNDDNFNLSSNTFGFITSINPLENFKLSALYFQRNNYQNNAEFINQLNSTQKYLSFSHEITFDNLFLTGEFSIFEKSVASINTLQLSLLRTILIVASIRNYPSNYKSYYGQGFGETKRTNNEFGIYLGFKWRANFGTINFYIDQFKFPNSTSSIALPSSGNELSFSYEYSPFAKTNFYFKYFSENKEVLELIEKQNNIVNRKTDKYRFELIYEVSKSLKVKTRIELLIRNQIRKTENGILLFQDVKYYFPKKLSIYGRIIFFQTDSFESRIYEFENDLTGVMTNPALWGSGVKWYFIIRYSPLYNLYISAKYSELYKPTESFLGSSFNLIEGNIDNKISFQIDFNF
jgi:Helix-hairpin-helix motif